MSYESEFKRVIETHKNVSYNGMVQIVYSVLYPTHEIRFDISQFIKNYNARNESQEIILQDDTLILQDKPKLFIKDLSYKTYYVYKTLKTYAVGYDNKKTVKYILDKLQNDYNVNMNDRDLRHAITELKNSHTITRIIGSNTNGIWLACTDDQIDANAMILSRTLNSMKTLLNNGVNVNVFFDTLNELKRTHHASHNQQRNQFHTEHKEIHRYSNDLLQTEE